MNPRLIGPFLARSAPYFGEEDVRLVERYLREVHADDITKPALPRETHRSRAHVAGVHPLIVRGPAQFRRAAAPEPAAPKLANFGASVTLTSIPLGRTFTPYHRRSDRDFVSNRRGDHPLLPSGVRAAGTALALLLFASVGVKTIRRVRPEWHQYVWRYILLWLAAITSLALALVA